MKMDYKSAIAKRAASEPTGKTPTHSLRFGWHGCRASDSAQTSRNQRLFRASARSRVAILELFHGSFENPWRGALWSVWRSQLPVACPHTERVGHPTRYMLCLVARMAYLCFLHPHMLCRKQAKGLQMADGYPLLRDYVGNASPLRVFVL